MKYSNIKRRLPLIAAVLIFSISSLDYFLKNYLWLGFLNLFIAICNLLTLKFSLKHFELTSVFISILNATISIVTAWLFIDADKSYIQFAWIAVAVAYLFIAYLFLNKAQKMYLS